MTDALTLAIAQIEANGSSGVTRRALIETDPRIKRLHAIEQRFEQQITGHGMVGARQVLTFLSGAANIQVIRARALTQARINQLYGYRPGVASKLARAAEIRRQISRFHKGL